MDETEKGRRDMSQPATIEYAWEPTLGPASDPPSGRGSGPTSVPGPAAGLGPEERARLTELGHLIISHRGAWTKADYEALPEGLRAELHDGRLILVPSPEAEHQYAERLLANRLGESLGNSKLAHTQVDVWMADGLRYRIPDVTVLRLVRRGRPFPAQAVLLVAEILSPGGGEEYGDKWIAYREAGLEWYLILRPGRGGGYGAELYHLEEGDYVLVTKADTDQPLRLPPPFDAELDLANLRL